MATTQNIDLTDAWVEVAAGPIALTIQNRSGFNVLLHVAASAPAGGTTVGILLGLRDKEWNVPPLLAGDRMFARAAGVSAAITVVAI
jgi:hypothetical protein